MAVMPTCFRGGNRTIVSTMESQGCAGAPINLDAATALEDIGHQQRLVAERVGRDRWRYPVLGLLLGTAAAA
jgi:hypothetical protein